MSSSEVNSYNNDNALTTPLMSEEEQQTPITSSSIPQRLLDRDAMFHQSRGHWAIQRLSSSRRPPKAIRSLMRSIWEDWFHFLAHRPTIQLMGIIFACYALLVFSFAYIYLGVSLWGASWMNHQNGGSSAGGGDGDGGDVANFCDMDITNHMEALYFSLSTMTTLGYGVSDYYFGDCWTPLLLVLCQSCCAITFQSVAIGLLFQRISRGQKRGKSIVFSNQACILTVRGKRYLLMRVGELRKHSLIDVTVKCFAIQHVRCKMNGGEVETAHFVTRHVPLCYPNEDVNSHIFMNVPQVLCHCIDDPNNAPLLPSKDVWYDAQGNTHSSTDIQSYYRDVQLEIILHVKGTDGLTGQLVQARHSYSATNKDLAWNCTFSPCVSLPDETLLRRRRCCRGDNSIACQVDFSKFHEVQSVHNSNMEDCPYIPPDAMHNTKSK